MIRNITLKKIAEDIKAIMAAKNIEPKELSRRTKISYPTIIAILSGTRDCSLSKFIAIAETLDCDTEKLLISNEVNERSAEIKYLAVFISIIKVTYCMLYEIGSNSATNSVMQFPLRCGDDSKNFLNYIFSSIKKLAKDLKKNIDPKEVAVFASVQQFGRKTNREKIQGHGETLFSKFILESDAISNHQAFFEKENGICITINDGSAITYSIDRNETIFQIQGHGFPISDTAGNYWIGCEVIRHVINVKENRESSSLISDQFIALLDDNIDRIYEYVTENPREIYCKASAIVKEFIQQLKAQEIIKKSFNLLLVDIEIIDKKIGTQLPIFVSGELAYLYEGFFPKERLIKVKEQQSKILLNYGLSKLKELIENTL